MLRMLRMNSRLVIRRGKHVYRNFRNFRISKHLCIYKFFVLKHLTRVIGYTRGSELISGRGEA